MRSVGSLQTVLGHRLCKEFPIQWILDQQDRVYMVEPLPGCSSAVFLEGTLKKKM